MSKFLEFVHQNIWKDWLIFREFPAESEGVGSSAVFQSFTHDVYVVLSIVLIRRFQYQSHCGDISYTELCNMTFLERADGVTINV